MKRLQIDAWMLLFDFNSKQIKTILYLYFQMPKRNVALFKSPVDSGEEDKYCQYLTSRGHTVHLVPVIQFDFINEEVR